MGDEFVVVQGMSWATGYVARWCPGLSGRKGGVGYCLLIVVVGLMVVVVGLLAWSGGLSWFGRLPGDIRIERGTCAATPPLYPC